MATMKLLLTAALFFVTALAEILGCYLPYLWLRQGKSAWLLLPAAFSLAIFSWLLTLHPAATGRVYAAYGGVYVTVAILWLWGVDGVRPSRWDVIGVTLCLTGMAVIVAGHRSVGADPKSRADLPSSGIHTTEARATFSGSGDHPSD